jgi:hypothetical protein
VPAREFKNHCFKEPKMANTYLFAPWFSDRQRGVLRVKSVQVSTASPWATYSRYIYVSGVGTKLSQIPRHICGCENSAIEKLERVQRLISFMDATGCRPIATDTCPQTHKSIRLIEWTDHITFWHGPNKESLVLVEPYTTIAEVLEEIKARKLTALVLPNLGIYGGGGGQTVSVLFADSTNADLLKQLHSIVWGSPLGEIQDINWYEALNLGKGRQS